MPVKKSKKPKYVKVGTLQNHRYGVRAKVNTWTLQTGPSAERGRGCTAPRGGGRNPCRSLGLA